MEPQMTLNIETTPFQFQAEYGYDSQVIHCLLTGAPIGRLYDHEYEGILSVCNSLDDLRIRSIAAMRPSSRWNKLEPQSLIELRAQRPREVLAFFMNRLFQATPTMKLDLWLEREARIITYQVSATIPQDYVDKLTHILVELDAKVGLHSIYPDSRAKLSLDDFHWGDDDTRMIYFLERLTKYSDRLLDDHAEREEMHERMTSPWSRRLYVKSWMELQPESKSAETARVRQEKADDMAEIIRRVSDGKTEVDQPESKPVVSNAFKMGFAALKAKGV
jgi:hypothetical protein